MIVCYFYMLLQFLWSLCLNFQKSTKLRKSQFCFIMTWDLLILELHSALYNTNIQPKYILEICKDCCLIFNVLIGVFGTALLSFLLHSITWENKVSLVCLFGRLLMKRYQSWIRWARNHTRTAHWSCASDVADVMRLLFSLEHLLYWLSQENLCHQLAAHAPIMMLLFSLEHLSERK